MQCSVVIPCHNGAALTRKCIQSLLGQDGGPPLEIVLVDNASTDDTPTLVHLHPSIRLLPQPRNLGFGAGTNAGIRASRGEQVLLLNNDTQSAPNLLAEMQRVLASSSTIGAVAPVSNHVKGPARIPVGGMGQDAAGRREIAAALQHDVAIQDVDNLAGLCLLLQRTTLDRVGCFDERFGHGNFEDDDLCLRLRLHGCRLVIARRAFLHHEGHATFRALGMDLPTEIDRRRRQFVDKWQTDPAGRATIAAMQADPPADAAAAAAARRIWPSWPDAHWQLARHCTSIGDHAGAAEQLRNLLRLCPRHSDAARALGLALLAQGDIDRGCAQLLHAAQAFHFDADQLAGMLLELGRHELRRGRSDTATAHFRAASELRPHDGGLHNWIGVSQLDRGDLVAAERAFRAAIGAGFALAHTNLGICLHRQGRCGEARGNFARAVELLPDDVTARGNLAAAGVTDETTAVSSPGS